MIHNLNINDRAFNAIINKTKRVEIRANTGKHDYSTFKHGDYICFTNLEGEKIICKVLEVNHYSSVEKLIISEGTKYTTSSTDDFEEAVQRINSLSGYKEEIKKTGVYAIHIEYLYKNSDIWNELYNIAKETLNPRDINDHMSAGEVAAAILSKKGNIYTGVCIDMSCSIGMCAERNAISTMITHGESEIDKLVCVGSNGNLMLPCGVCREFMMQLGSYNKELEILTNIEKKEIVKLKELLPNWWGK